MVAPRMGTPRRAPPWPRSAAVASAAVPPLAPLVTGPGRFSSKVFRTSTHLLSWLGHSPARAPLRDPGAVPCDGPAGGQNGGSRSQPMSALWWPLPPLVLWRTQDPGRLSPASGRWARVGRRLGISPTSILCLDVGSGRPHPVLFLYFAFWHDGVLSSPIFAKLLTAAMRNRDW